MNSVSTPAGVIEADALIVGAGCSHGLIGTFNSIDRISYPGRATPIVNLSRFLMTHPVAHPNPGDFEPDGSWYSLDAAGDTLYAFVLR